MEEIEKPYHITNKLNHPSIEDIAAFHNQLLNDMLSFPNNQKIEPSNIPISPLRTPNDNYKDYLLQQIKTYKETSTEQKE